MSFHPKMFMFQDIHVSQHKINKIMWHKMISCFSFFIFLNQQISSRKTYWFWCRLIYVFSLFYQSPLFSWVFESTTYFGWVNFIWQFRDEILEAFCEDIIYCFDYSYLLSIIIIEMENHEISRSLIIKKRKIIINAINFPHCAFPVLETFYDLLFVFSMRKRKNVEHP
jgi:hypothetical protein